MSCPNNNCSHEVQQMCCVAKGAKHGPAPIPEEGKWVKSKQISDISGLTHGVGWCAPQAGRVQAHAQCQGRRNQGSPRRNNRLLGHDALGGLWRRKFSQAKPFSKPLIPTSFATQSTSPCANFSSKSSTDALRRLSRKAVSPSARVSKTWARVCARRSARCSRRKSRARATSELAEGYVLEQALDENNEVIGYKTVHVGKMLEAIRNGMDAGEAFKKFTSTKGRFEDAAKTIDPRKE